MGYYLRNSSRQQEAFWIEHHSIIINNLRSTMATNFMYLLTICSTLFSVGTLASHHCFTQVQMGKNQREYNYGPCTLRIQEKTDQNIPGQLVLANVTLSSSSGCPKNEAQFPGYVHLPGHGYYKYHSTPKKWIEAWKICKNEGGHLAVFNSEKEAKFVGSIPKTTYKWAFIGFHDFYEEGKYITIFDQTLQDAGWSKWDKNNPHGIPEENCGVTFPDGDLGDYVCSTPCPFFCEIGYRNSSPS